MDESNTNNFDPFDMYVKLIDIVFGDDELTSKARNIGDFYNKLIVEDTVEEVLHNLQTIEREAFILRESYGFKYREIGNRINVCESRASLVFRGSCSKIRNPKNVDILLRIFEAGKDYKKETEKYWIIKRANELEEERQKKETEKHWIIKRANELEEERQKKEIKNELELGHLRPEFDGRIPNSREQLLGKPLRSYNGECNCSQYMDKHYYHRENKIDAVCNRCGDPFLLLWDRKQTETWLKKEKEK